MLARVFATEPEMFLLDEPTADLDPAASHAIPRLLCATAGAAAVVVRHDAYRVVLARPGRIEAAVLFGMRAGTRPRLLPSP